MDVSKLPKFSQTPPAPPSEGDPAPPTTTTGQGGPHPNDADDDDRIIYAHAIPAGPEAWISAGMGVLILLLNPRVLQYVFHKVCGAPWTWTFNDGKGNPLEYPQTVFFWGDLVVTLFCVVLILDAAVMLWSRNRTLIGIALVCTVVVAIGNLIYLVATFNQGVAIISALAFFYGGFIAIQEWRLLQVLNARKRA